MVKVIWTLLAREDIKAIYEYISKDSVYYAKRFTEKIIDKVEILESHPNLGRIVPEFENNSIRELIEGNYRIIYHLLEDRVEIIRVHHAAMKLS